METPKTNADMVAWLIESFKRFGLKTPAFFQVWQIIGIIALLVGYIPKALVYLEITPSEVFNDRLQLILKVAGAVTWFTSKMPVLNTVMPTTGAGVQVQQSEALPFTSKKQQ